LGSVKGSKDRSTILLEVSLNALSYSFATHGMENGIDLRYMQELLGYKVVGTIMIYTHVPYKGGLL
jgi:site-specific recombinase XerD